MTTGHNNDGPSSAPVRAPGVYRCDAEGELSSRFNSLIEAQWEPPLSPEARIVTYDAAGREVVLAEALGRGWRITMSGATRICADAHGEVAA